MTSKNNKVFRLVLAAMFLALALVLPFLTMQIPKVGKMLSPMHIPVMLCGFFCGPWNGLIVGLLAPILRFSLFGKPNLMPDVVVMMPELATYGLVIGILYSKLPKKKISIYLSLIPAMLAGKIVWGLTYVLLTMLGEVKFGWALFLSKGFVDALPGLLVQIILIPILVMVLKKNQRAAE